MENFSEYNLTRRNFVKGALATAGAVALATAAPAVKPFEAFADTAIVEGATYQVNAEFYISKQILLMDFNAYLTNANDPNQNQGRPNSPNGTLNSTLVMKDGSYFVTVPLINPCFMLCSATAGDDGISSVSYTTAASEEYTDTDGNEIQRIYEITLELSSQKSSYTLGTCKEYGAYTSAPWPLSKSIPGYVNWPATLEVSWSTATAL